MVLLPRVVRDWRLDVWGVANGGGLDEGVGVQGNEDESE